MPVFKAKTGGLSRRAFVRRVAALVTLGMTLKEFLLPGFVSGQAGSAGMPLPDEKVEATVKRLFGTRPLSPGEDKIKLELPLIAEDGGNVGVSVDANLPMTATSYVSNIYIISDQNRRPLLAKFSFTPEAGKASIATSIRLATTTDVRAVVEMNDGALYSVSRHVRVTVSGCDMPAT
jgi:sulfur-oxidizing protein SoxY